MNSLNVTMNINIFTGKDAPFKTSVVWVVILAVIVAALLVVFYVSPELCAKFVRALISTSLD